MRKRRQLSFEGFAAAQERADAGPVQRHEVGRMVQLDMFAFEEAWEDAEHLAKARADASCDCNDCSIAGEPTH
jgi:hypothetical protein